MLTLVATEIEVRFLDGARLVGLHARVWGQSRVMAKKMSTCFGERANHL